MKERADIKEPRDRISNKPFIAENYRTLVLSAAIASISTAALLIALKLVVWLVGGSSSILASLTDSILDLGASLVNFLALRYALSPPDREHRFGHFKAEALASLTQAAFIGGSALLLIFHGLERSTNPEPIQAVTLGIAVSVLSAVFTLVLVAFQSFVCSVTGSQAVGADRLHYLSDLLLNLCVIAALILTKRGFWWADGVFTALIGVFLLRGSLHLGLKAASTLLDHSFDPKENESIIRALLKTPGIRSVHDLRTRRAGPQSFIQCHIVIDGNSTLKQAHDISTEAEKRVCLLYSDADVTLHMEPDEDATYKDIMFHGRADLDADYRDDELLSYQDEH